MLGCQRFAQQRIVQQVDLPDGQIVGGSPPGVDQFQLFTRQRPGGRGFRSGHAKQPSPDRSAGRGGVVVGGAGCYPGSVGPNSWLAMLSQTLGRRRMVPHHAALRTDVGSERMGNATPEQFGPRIPQETSAQQCLIRDANEAIETLNAALSVTAARLEFRCECGDPLCQERLSVTGPEYERVRSSGSHFVIALNHGKPAERVGAERELALRGDRRRCRRRALPSPREEPPPRLGRRTR